MTSFAQFTDTKNNNASVIINPQHVVYVRSVGSQTWIGTTGSTSDGGNVVFVVAEDAEEVLRRLAPA